LSFGREDENDLDQLFMALYSHMNPKQKHKTDKRKQYIFWGFIQLGFLSGIKTFCAISVFGIVDLELNLRF